MQQLLANNFFWNRTVMEIYPLVYLLKTSWDGIGTVSEVIFYLFLFFLL